MHKSIKILFACIGILSLLTLSAESGWFNHASQNNGNQRNQFNQTNGGNQILHGTVGIVNLETLTFSNKQAAINGSISNVDLAVVDQFITAEKNTGNLVWDIDCGFHGGNNTNTATTKLISGNGIWYEKIIGLHNTDWNKFRGWNNAGTGYIDTTFTNTTPSMCYSNGMEVFIPFPVTTLLGGNVSAGYIAGAFMHNNGGSAALLVQSTSFPEASVGNLNKVTPGSYGPYWGVGAGLFGYSQQSTNLTVAFQNGMINQINTTASPTNANGFAASVMLFGVNNFYSGIYLQTTNLPIAWYCIDSGRPTNLLASHWHNVLNLMIGLGRCSGYKISDEDGVMVGGQSLATGGGNLSLANPLPNVQTNQSSTLLCNGGETIPTLNGNAVGIGGNLGAGNTIAGYCESPSSPDGWDAFGPELDWQYVTNGVTDPTTFFGNWAWAGKGISSLQQGSSDVCYFTNQSTYYPTVQTATNLFENSMVWFQNAQANWTNLYKVSLAMKAIIWIHGQTDRASTTYETNIEALDKNYWTRMNAINGKTNVIPMLMFQESSFYYPNSSSDFPQSDMEMVRAMEHNYPSNTIIGPAYMFQYDAITHIHLGNRTMYQWQAEYAAKAYYQMRHNGWWQPLWSTNCVRTGSTISWTLNRNNVIIDTNSVITTPNYGFLYTNSLQQSGISSVYIDSVNSGTSNRLNVVLSSDPSSATWATLTYAINNTAGTLPGCLTGARGNIRDQDSAAGICTSSNLPNWMIHLEDTNAISTVGHYPAL